ncbi:DNA-methyltransferase [Micromonospora inyonensis]|uniref:Methyltransferase n=1 Tax=Micromonospora inyonensis TaxID=47866 RepID=A0A1C6RX48_9ACTN|nr:site-specific DNA-methyltransferase [Micromonospora inyonensis]SCL21643.1 site-specific DNA-methyltransferase (cytosine-N4-specific) [Micromonospora inyonensis]
MTPYYADDTVTLHHGDSLTVLRALPSGSVNCVVTSPPYYGLRDYGEPGQYGLESSPAAYVDRMREVFAEVRRVLADDGTLWLNLGDSYSSTGGTSGVGPNAVVAQTRRQDVERTRPSSPLPPKNLLGIPWRVAFALQDDGWILRSEIIWAKRNFMPEAVKDRPTRAHEHVFLMTKRPRYYFDADAIREESDPEQEAHNRRYAKEYTAHTERASDTGQPGNVNNIGIHSRPGRGGRNSRDVWSISAQPFPGAHFAVMPPELARRCIAAGSRTGDVVLDPFAGSCTTGMVAGQLGRRFVGIDLSATYLDLALRTRLAQGALMFGGAA